MKRYPILEVCARIEGHEIQHQILREYCRGFDDWQGLLECSEREGMAPLLRKHLLESEADIPPSVRRSLSVLYKRHQRHAAVRLQVMEEILDLFQQHRLTPMLIKGAALCCTLYSDPGLRPMRDMDILFRPSEVDEAQGVLRSVGFIQSAAPIASDHFHLPSLHKTIENVTICIELHRGLYPNCPPHYPEVDFEYLLRTGRKISVANFDAMTFSDEETLDYLYQHAFRTPLTYEPYKLINAADIISFTEKYFHTLGWHLIRERFPLTEKTLPLLHHISPWNFESIPESFISSKARKRRMEPLPFNGWPRKRRKELQAEGKPLSQILLTTFLPSKWWLGVYYGELTALGCLRCLLWRHPAQIKWWYRLLSLYSKKL
ncbi:nucleotidyltransferase family protein [Desulforhopalus sp. 52FAK]